ncbi:MAG: hypothetical protein GC180_06635 [Bacteroidetes bacterium]|nr:hypothetical protein [Bacteroidota bacterium]
MKPSSPPDSIELASFLDYLKGFKRFVNQIIATLFKIIGRHFLWILLPLVLTLGYGYFKYTGQDPVYHLEMQLTYNELYKRTYGEMIVQLNQQLQNKNYSYVAKELQMKGEDVMRIAKIEALNFAKSPLEEDVSKEKLPFYILADVKDTRISSDLQNGLLYYLKNNPLNQERRRVNLVNLKDRLNFLEGQLAWMDSIKVNYNQQLRLGKISETTGNEMAIDRLFSLSDTFYKEWLGARSGLESYEAVELIMGFSPGPKPQAQSFLHFMSKYFILGLLAGLALTLWLAIPTKESE